MIGLIIVPIIFAIKGIVVGVQKVKQKFGKHSKSKHQEEEDRDKYKGQGITKTKQKTEWPIEENRIQKKAPNQLVL